MSGMSEFPIMQDRKLAKAGKSPLGPGPIGGGAKNKKVYRFEKKVFFRLGKHIVGWKQNLSVGNKNVGWRISPAKDGNV